MSSRGSDEWIVLLEATGSGASTVDCAGVRRLMAAWPGSAPTTLFSENRYALQLTVRAASPTTALSDALRLWHTALGVAGLPHSELVRAEIVTPPELARELAAAESDAMNLDEPRPVNEAFDPVSQDLLGRALYDSITGLPGTEVFLDEIRRAPGNVDAPTATRAVIVVDIGVPSQGHRPVNGVPPTAALVELATRLRHAVRRNDTVARIGATSFGILISVPSPKVAHMVARRVAAAARRRWPCHIATELPTAAVDVATTSEANADDVLHWIELAGEGRALGADRPSLQRTRIPRHEGRCAARGPTSDG